MKQKTKCLRYTFIPALIINNVVDGVVRSAFGTDCLTAAHM